MDDDQIQSEVLKAAFGESSDGEDFADQTQDGNCRTEDPVLWEQVEEINGLWICRNFLSSHHQSSLLSAILNEGWFAEESHNQAMRFGDLPSWAIKLSDSIRDAVESINPDAINNSSAEMSVLPLPTDLLWREPLFDQLIVNMYKPGEGICAHVDLLRFEDGIAVVSLGSPCVMGFSRGGDEASSNGEKVDVFLDEGSLILMSGEARYLWKHEINRKPGFQIWDGTELDQKLRISVTLRKLCPS
ncbi:PREDICTED: alkylated DNA repair protein alkB homolog 8 [Tarenaya hassleriana]|uniref:alkylated DNA repair protein alkB homolog 8 n=1 Tax=Tarenaya hassleriana TaxID=28532 RepID=UPI00053C811D|nr:PREDICTED: alkylated DNA repair protein alkB homolog 8 [Tarenaya hassleriana]